MVEFESRSGTVYEMPELDGAMYDKQEAVDRATDMDTRFNAAWSFIKSALPDECIIEELGFAEKRKVGVPRIMSLYQRVKSAYWKEYNDEQLEDLQGKMAAVGDVPKIIEAFSQAQRFMDRQNGRSFFKAVK